MRRDDGFVAVATAGLALVLVSVATLVATLGAVAVARHRAAAAADLAALAAASHAYDGTGCASAEGVARAQGGVLETCRLDGGNAYVVVSVRPAGRLGDLGRARAQARAGSTGAPVRR